uniref:Secreted protein n=1 Tax=Plectus sambesii TaxID=2011161 RepID=A0A914VKF3_9BILA
MTTMRRSGDLRFLTLAFDCTYFSGCSCSTTASSDRCVVALRSALMFSIIFVRSVFTHLPEGSWGFFFRCRPAVFTESRWVSVDASRMWSPSTG